MSTIHRITLIIIFLVVTMGAFPSDYVNAATAVQPSTDTATARDIVLVIDTTLSMARDTGVNPSYGDPSDCNPSHTCQPLESVKSAALDFIQTLSFPNDRVAIITMTSQNPGGSRTPITVLHLTSDITAIEDAIKNIRVYEPPVCPTEFGACLFYSTSDGTYIAADCPVYYSTHDPSSCTFNDVGTAMLLAGNEFILDPVRADAQKIVIPVVANPASASVSETHPFGFCPPSDWFSPFCRDASASTRHPITDPNYDADDYARDKSDFVSDPTTGRGAKVFTIGLGYNIRYAPHGDPDAGEKLLQYMALTAGGEGANHGAYFYAPTFSDLPVIFQNIADSITHPVITSITRANASPTDLLNVDFTVTFSEPVTGVAPTDFTLMTSGVSDALISSVSGLGNTYTVAVSTGSGSGTIRLDVPTTATITDLVNNPVAGLPFIDGEIYTIIKNAAPTDLALSAATMIEGLPAGLTVGTFTTTDPDSGDTFTYAFCGATGDTFFSIDTDTLRTSASFDFEARSSYSICVRTIDNGGLAFDKTFTVSVTDVNERATNLSLSNTTTPEGLPSGSTVGTFIVIDPDSNDYHIFAFCAGIDNSFFSIYNDTLYTTATLDYEGKASYSLCIRAIDSGGLTFEKTLTINVADVNEPPFNLFLSSYTVTEGLPSGSTVGTFTTTDPDLGDTFTYSLVSGSGNDNAAFTISGNELKTAYPFNYLAKSSFAINVRTTDSGGLHYEKTFTITVIDKAAIFSDVSEDYWAASWIERLFNAGVTSGCSNVPKMYCPDAYVNRAQMAVFLLRAKHGYTYTPPTASGSRFSDVPADYWAAAWIEQLATEGITGGCGNGNYCPETVITRDQMAIFLLRGKYGNIYFPPTASGAMFTDVSSNYWAAAWIEQLASEGITGGCGSGNYCPTMPVTRAQMAVFLVKAFSLP